MNTQRRLSRLATAVALSLTLGLAACGGSSTSTSDSISSSDAIDNAEDLLSDANDCIAAASAYNVLVQSLVGAISNPSSFDKAKWLESVEKARKVVPKELADDFNTLAEAYSKAADALEGVKGVDMSDPKSYADPAYIAAMTTAGEVLDRSDIQAIGQRLTDYFTKECA